MPSRAEYEKEQTLKKLLESGRSIFLHLDPRRADVAVPDHLRGGPSLILQIGMKLAVPIPDLEVGANGVRCTLSFSRVPHACWLPWTSIFALVLDDGTGAFWPADTPTDVQMAVASNEQSAATEPAKDSAQSQAEPGSGEAPKRPARLRLVN